MPREHLSTTKQNQAAQCVWLAGAILGEGPVWDAREDALYFVDIKRPRVMRYCLRTGARKSWDMPEPIGWLIPRETKPGFIAGFKSGFAELTLDPVSIHKIGDPEPDRPGNRLNDAKADKYGRIWAGSMDDAERSLSGALYRLDPDLTWTRIEDGYGVANGPAFSRDGDVLYHTDSSCRTVSRFDLNANGALTNRDEFVRFEQSWGYPDGMTTDAEDGIWIAHWDGARISRFTPDGKLDRAIAMPVSRPTSIAFAGENLDRMFVTSAALGCAEEAEAGGLFEVTAGLSGAPVYRFAG